MRHSKEFEVDEIHYTTSHFPAAAGLELGAELAKLFGEPLATLSASGGLDADIVNGLAPAVAALAKHIEPKEFVSLAKRILATTRARGENGFVDVGPQFDNHFMGRHFHLFKVLAEVLKYQFEDFSNAFASLQSLGVAEAVAT